MPNMKASSHRIKKLRPMLKFFKSRPKVTVKVTCSKFKFGRKGLVIRYTHATYESPICYNKKVMANVNVFFKSRSKVTLKVTCSKFMVPLEGLVIRITHAKYERPISKGKKVMANGKVF